MPDAESGRIRRKPPNRPLEKIDVFDKTCVSVSNLPVPAHRIRGQQATHPAGVAAQQPQAVLVGGVRVDHHVPVRADPGGAAVDGPLRAGAPVATPARRP